MAKVYVARKSCGHIVAAFPVSMEQNAKAEILKQFTKAGYDIEQTGEGEIGLAFAITCDCNKPPLLKAIDEVKAEDPNNDGGAEQEDVDAAANEDETEDQSIYEPE